MANISKVRVKNYSSIRDSEWIPIEDSCTTILGPNGAGKSNFLTAVTEFGRQDPIPRNKLCKYSSAPNREKSTIPIVSIKFSNLGLSDAPYVHPPLLPSDLRSPVTHRMIGEDGQPAEVNSDLDVSQNLTPEEITITRYADGAHKVHLNDGRRLPIEELLSKRAKELQAIGQGLLRQLKKLSFPSELDLPDGEVTLSDLQAVDSNLTEYTNEQISQDQIPTSGTATLEYINRDIQEVTSVLSEIENPAFEPLRELPPLFNNTSIELVDGSVPLEEVEKSPAYQGFLDAAGVRPKDVSKFEEEEVGEKISRAEDRLSNLLNGYLALDSAGSGRSSQVATKDGSGEFEIIASLTREQLKINIKDGTDISFAAHQQSTGIRWLLGFLLTVIHGVGDNDGPGLVILDDPGVHLHPEAQELLLASLETLTPRKQVLYSTHSPFLIDNSRLNSNRLVEHEGVKGTVIHNKPHRTGTDIDMDSMAPIRDSLGARLATLPFGGGQNIIVEGPTDRKYLNAFEEYFNSIEGPEIGKEVAFIDGSGGRISYMAQFMEAEELEYEILLDDKGSGLVEGILKAGIDEGKIHRLSDALSYSPSFDIEFEDILPEKLVCDVAVELQDRDVSREDIRQALEDRDTRIMHEIDSELAQVTRGDYCLGKEKLADDICYEVRKCAQGDSEFDGYDLSDIEDIFNYLNELLER